MLPGVTLRVPSIVANDARTRHEDPLGAAFLPRAVSTFSPSRTSTATATALVARRGGGGGGGRAADPEEVENTSRRVARTLAQSRPRAGWDG